MGSKRLDKKQRRRARELRRIRQNKRNPRIRTEDRKEQERGRE